MAVKQKKSTIEFYEDPKMEKQTKPKQNQTHCAPLA